MEQRLVACERWLVGRASIVGNEGQQPPGQGQPGYYGWQYDQDNPELAPQQPPAGPRAPLFLPPQPAAQPPPPVQQPPQPYTPSAQQPRRPSQHYQEPVADMGTTLGYGQGMEYQYFDAPQPSQQMAQLRVERLQQLREERMRRQQRRMNTDITTMIPWRNKANRQAPTPPPGAPPQARGPQMPPAGPVSQLPLSAPPRQPGPPPVQMSPLLSLPAREVAPVRSSTTPPTNMQMSPELGIAAAESPAQDTGMIQRVRIGRAATILTGAFIASRFLGLLRTSLFAFVFGTSQTSDAYLQAFLIPDLIFNIVAGGALSSAFIPVFTKYMVDRDDRTAWHVASAALNLAVAIMMALALFAIIFAPWLVPLYNPGVGPQEMGLIISLTRITLLQAILLGGGVIVNAILNAQQDFLRPAIGTVLYNVGLIAGLLPGIYFAYQGQRNDTVAVYAATIGVVIGAILQVGVQVPGLWKVGMKYDRSFDWRNPAVIQIGRQMVPRIINAAMLYFSTFVDRGLILLLAAVAVKGAITGLVTQYYQAFQLMQLPLGIFGMSIATAAFPVLAENVAKARWDRVRNTILETLRSIIFMSMPSAIGLIVLGVPIMQVLLEHGHFSLDNVQSTAIPLACVSIGLVGLTSVEILTRAFYAMRDSITPVAISVGQFIFKIALSLLLINVAVFGGPSWGMGALALATSIAGVLEAIVLFWVLHQRVGGLQVRTISLFLVRVTIAAVVMGIGLLITRTILDVIPFLVTTKEPSLGIGGTIVAAIKLMIELFVGLFIYIRVSRLLGIEELGPVKRVLDRLKLSWI